MNLQTVQQTQKTQEDSTVNGKTLSEDGNLSTNEKEKKGEGNRREKRKMRMLQQLQQEHLQQQPLQ